MAILWQGKIADKFLGKNWNDADASGFLRNAHSLCLGVTTYEWIGKDNQCRWRSAVCFSDGPTPDRSRLQASSRHCFIPVWDRSARPFFYSVLRGHGLLLSGPGVISP